MKFHHFSPLPGKPFFSWKNPSDAHAGNSLLLCRGLKTDPHFFCSNSPTKVWPTWCATSSTSTRTAKRRRSSSPRSCTSMESLLERSRMMFALPGRNNCSQTFFCLSLSTNSSARVVRLLRMAASRTNTKRGSACLQKAQILFFENCEGDFRVHVDQANLHALSSMPQC